LHLQELCTHRLTDRMIIIYLNILYLQGYNYLCELVSFQNSSILTLMTLLSMTFQ